MNSLIPKFISNLFTSSHVEPTLPLVDIQRVEKKQQFHTDTINKNISLIGVMIFTKEPPTADWNVYHSKKIKASHSTLSIKMEKKDVISTYEALTKKIDHLPSLQKWDDRLLLLSLFKAAVACSEEKEFWTIFEWETERNFKRRPPEERSQFLQKLHNFFLKNLPAIRGLREFLLSEMNDKQRKEWVDKVRKTFGPCLNYHSTFLTVSGAVHLKCYQFMMLLELFKRDGFVNPIIASNEHVRRLTALAASCVNDLPFLLRETPFHVEELNEKMALIEEHPFLHEKESWLEHFISKFNGALKEGSKDRIDNLTTEELKTAFEDAIRQFFTDRKRSGIKFRIERNQQSEFEAIDGLLVAYKQWLLKNPESLKVIIAKEKESPFFRRLMTAFPQFFHSSHPWKSLLHYFLSKDIYTDACSSPDAALKPVVWEQEELKKASLLSGIADGEEIEGLLDKKMIELMLITHQSLFASLTSSVHKHICQDFSELPLSAVYRLLEFSPDLNSFDLYVDYQIRQTGEQLNQSHLHDWTTSQRPVATISGKLSIKNINQPGSTVVMHPCREVLFNWDVPANFVSHLMAKHSVRVIPFSERKIRHLVNSVHVNKIAGDSANKEIIPAICCKMDVIFHALFTLARCSDRAITYKLDPKLDCFTNMQPFERETSKVSNLGSLHAVWQNAEQFFYSAKRFGQPFRSSHDLESIVIGLNRLQEETLDVIRLISRWEIEEINTNLYDFFKVSKELESLVAQGASKQIASIIQNIEDPNQVLKPYLTSISDNLFTTIGKFFACYHERLINDIKPSVHENITPLQDLSGGTLFDTFHAFEKAKTSYQEVSIVNHYVNIPEGLVHVCQYFNDIKTNLSHTEIKHRLKLQREKFKTHLLASLLTTQERSLIWLPVANHFDFLSNRFLGRYIHSKPTDHLKNFKIQIEHANPHLALTCGVIDTEQKMEEYRQTLTRAIQWMPSHKDKPLRLVMHQYNSSIRESELVRNEQRWSRRLESTLSSTAEPRVAHINTCLNFASKFGAETKNSRRISLEGLATLGLWAVEDVVNEEVKGIVDRVSIVALTDTARLLKQGRTKIINAKEKSLSSLSDLQTATEGLLIQVVNQLKSVTKAINAINKPSATLIKAKNIECAFSALVKAQAENEKELTDRNLSFNAHVEMQLILDMLLGCVTSMNCKSGLDRTGLVRSYWDALRTTWKNYIDADDLKNMPLPVREQIAYGRLINMVIMQDTHTLGYNRKLIDFLDKHKVPVNDDIRKPMEIASLNLLLPTNEEKFSVLYQNLVLKNLLSVATIVSMESRGAPGLKYGQDAGFVESFFSNDNPVYRLPMIITCGRNYIKLFELNTINGERVMTAAAKQLLLGFSQFEET